jgi:hypothetical protein
MPLTGLSLRPIAGRMTSPCLSLGPRAWCVPAAGSSVRMPAELKGTNAMIEEKEFTGATLEEANAEANNWLAEQKGVRLIRKREMSSADFGQEMLGVAVAPHAKWTVTLRYERTA